MKHVALSSSNVKRVGYDPRAQLMEIEFASGGRYHYHDVPWDKALGLVFADSPGQFFAKEIKPTYRCEKIEEAPVE